MGQCSERASVQGSERACVWFWYTVWVCVWCISNVCERAFPFVLVEWVVEVWVANATYINHDVCPAVTIVIPATRLKQNPSGSALLLDSHLCTRTHRSANGPNVFVCWWNACACISPVYISDIDRCDQMFSIVLALNSANIPFVYVCRKNARGNFSHRQQIQTIQFTRLSFVIFSLTYTLLFVCVCDWCVSYNCQFSARSRYLHTLKSLRASWFSLVNFSYSIFC